MDLSLQFRSDFMKYRCPGSGYHRHEITRYPWTISLVYRRIELAVPCAIYLCRVRLNIVRWISSESSSIRRIVISEWPPVSLSRSCQFTSVTLSLVSSIIQTSGVSEASMKLENISAFGTARTGYLSRYKGIYSVYDAFYGLTAIYRHLNVSNRPGETV